MTATAFSSVSVDPLLILVCVNRSTRTYRRVSDTRRFGVNILGSPARDISDYCARPGADKVLRPEWLTLRADWHAPALSGALAFLDCEVDQDVRAGTHAVLIGRVHGIGLSSAAPTTSRSCTFGAPTGNCRRRLSTHGPDHYLSRWRS